MIKRNVWKNLEEPLELHSDERGRIADIFYKKTINHVAIIDSKAGAVRGSHYHKKSIQHMLMTKGSMEYWYKLIDSKNRARCVVLKEGDIVTTLPNEIHALRFNKNAQFIVFSEGERGGQDYEKDTFRVTPSIIPYTK